MLHPMADLGISIYAYELAEALALNAVNVDLYTARNYRFSVEPHHYRHLPVIGQSVLLHPPQPVQNSVEADGNKACAPVALPNLNRAPCPSARFRLWESLRRFVLAFELVVYLKSKRYDAVWTQWPDAYGAWFSRFAKLFGLRVIHTVHNVVPHEREARDEQHYEGVYRRADHLMVHSEYARQELIRFLPQVAPKIIVQQHGVHTIFRRQPEARTVMRSALGITEQQVAVLCCGGIRPYKKIDEVLRAVGLLDRPDIAVVIAGEELGDSGKDDRQKLAGVREMARQLGIDDRVRFLPGYLPFDEMNRLFEACDVLVVAYEKHWGSGLLLQGMSYDLHIVATPIGGAEEYLQHHRRATIVPQADANGLAAALADAAAECRSVPRRASSRPDFQWQQIVRESLQALQGIPRPSDSMRGRSAAGCSTS
jgi:glycosyltransferase involved in cell wall biosynthesis